MDRSPAYHRRVAGSLGFRRVSGLALTGATVLIVIGVAVIALIIILAMAVDLTRGLRAICNGPRFA